MTNVQKSAAVNHDHHALCHLTGNLQVCVVIVIYFNVYECVVISMHVLIMVDFKNDIDLLTYILFSIRNSGSY